MRIISVDDEKGCLTTFELICKEISDVEYLKGFDNPVLVIDYLKENDVDVVFLDIEMPLINGLKLAEQIHEFNPEIALVFVTAHSSYALKAFEIEASGYILKPYNKIEIEQKIKTLQNISGETLHHKIYASTFGKFDIFVDGKTLHFSSNKAKELLALLIDHKGGIVTTEQAVKALWTDRDFDQKTKALYRMAVSALKKTLTQADISDIMIDQWGSKSVDTTKLECDYYLFMKDDVEAVSKFDGEYFSGYVWALETQNMLRKINLKKHEQKTHG